MTMRLMENRSNILMVEDEVDIRRLVRTTLEAEGYRVFEASTCERGLIEAGTRKPDLVILDLGLPDGDGMDFLRAFRSWSKVAVIVLSARSDELVKVAALDLGADDYLSKPFGVAELLARVRVALRRHGAVDTGSVVRFGTVAIDMNKRVVSKDGEVVHLTAMEFRLLCAVVRSPGAVLTHRQLLRDVWGPSAVENGHYVRVYMGRLRHRLEDDPARPRHFLTETGLGYRFLP
ncbi:two-component system response regulator KdpE [Metallibacterium sp.]|uniref:two-component system response regulator KdpE n=1 Tax=Metallibacterium sp. TaxID=2940281 RepID=UPI0026322885|nr:two-component system response regulator KdpE [Metallibacterium sp.]